MTEQIKSIFSNYGTPAYLEALPNRSKNYIEWVKKNPDRIIGFRKYVLSYQNDKLDHFDPSAIRDK